MDRSLEPGALQSMGLQRVGHNWLTLSLSVLIMFSMLHVTPLVFTCLIARSLCLWPCLSSFPSPHTSPLVTRNLVWVCLFLKCNIQRCVSSSSEFAPFPYGAGWLLVSCPFPVKFHSNLTFVCISNWWPREVLVVLCHHKKPVYNYGQYYLTLYISCLFTHLYREGKFVPFNLWPISLLPPLPSPIATSCSSLCMCDSV